MVVISIISLFSSIAFASFATVRVKAQEATIKSDLKSIKSQAEIAFNSVGDYSTASSAVSAMIEGINKSGGTAAFYTSDNTHYAVSAKLNSDPTKSWSVSDQTDTVVWDTTDINDGPSYKYWSEANTICADLGKRLPTIEEFKAIYFAYGGGSGSNLTNLFHFSLNRNYWSSSEVPTDTSRAYIFYKSGTINTQDKNSYSNGMMIRCVK